MLVGEGNFSFAAALCMQIGGKNLTATSLDSFQQVIKKYGQSSYHAIQAIKSSGCEVLHKIDVTKPNFLQLEKKYDRILFNFPHLGGSTNKDIVANQDLITQFLTNSLHYLQNKGEIHINLRNSKFYNSWKIKELVSTIGLKLKSKNKFKSLKLFKDLGYREVRTNPGFREAPETEKVLTYVITK